MALTRYKLWGIGEKLEDGVTDSFHVGVHGIAKTNVPGLPNVVVNEFICQQLAQAIRLPMPPGFIIEKDGAPHYVSLDFNLAGEDLPPVNPEKIVEQFPELSTGIGLYDTWVLNPDRHRRNIAYDISTGQIQFFDHSHALLSNEDIIAHLKENRERANLGQHCLARVLHCWDGWEDWYSRIMQVPEYYIYAVFQDSVAIGLAPDLVDYCTEYMIDRRKRLPSILSNSRNFFANLPDREWAKIN